MEECLLDIVQVKKMVGLCVDIPYIAFSWFLLPQISLFYYLSLKHKESTQVN